MKEKAIAIRRTTVLPSLWIGFLLCVGAAAGAETRVFSFDELPAGPFSEFNVGIYRFFDLAGTSDVSTGASYCSPECPENGTPYLIVGDGFGITSNFLVERLDGAPFTVVSIDLAEFEVGSPSVGTVTAVSTTGIESYPLDAVNDGSGPLADFETFAVGAATGADVVSYSTANLGNATPGVRYSIDNLVIEDADQVPILPLPAQLLLALALAGVALAAHGWIAGARNG